MTYATNGRYQQWGDYLVGYKVIRANGKSWTTSYKPLTYKAGKMVKAKDDDEDDDGSGGIYHAAELHEVRDYFDCNFNRVVRLLMKPEDMITRGQTSKAFVQAVSDIIYEWPKDEVKWPVVYEPSEWLHKPKMVGSGVREQLPPQLTEGVKAQDGSSGWGMPSNPVSIYYSSGYTYPYSPVQLLSHPLTPAQQHLQLAASKPRIQPATLAEIETYGVRA